MTSGRDNSVRIWDNNTRTEIAKLAHSSSVINVVWLGADVLCTEYFKLFLRSLTKCFLKGLASLGSNGIVSKWTMLVLAFPLLKYPFILT